MLRNRVRYSNQGIFLAAAFLVGGCSPNSSEPDSSLVVSISGTALANDGHLEELKILLKDDPLRLAMLLHPNISAAAEKLPDGNYASVITHNDGSQHRRVFMGARTIQEEIFQGIRQSQSKENQLALYEIFYTLWSKRADATQTSRFPKPDEVRQGIAEALPRLNQSLSQALLELKHTAPSSVTITETIAPAPSCDSEEGVGRRTDGSASCSRGTDSLFNKISFPIKSYLNCIKDQGNRGTCVAFAGAGAMETLAAVVRGRWVNLSEQDLYRFGKWMEDSGNFYGDGLNGWGTFSSAIVYYPQFAFEREWDYNPSNSRTDTGSSYRNSCVGYSGFPCFDSNHQAFCTLSSGSTCFRATDFVTKTSNVWLRSVGVLNTNDSGINSSKALLDAGYPVLLSFNVTNDFSTVGSTGIVRHTGSTLSRGGHAMEVVGYVDNSSLPAGTTSGSGGGYFIAKNSWSCSWGDGGYAYIPYDYIKANGYTFYVLWT